MKRTSPIDVVIAGAGPAGLALAAELAERDVRVVVVDPAPDAQWPATYCAFVDEIHALGLTNCISDQWSAPLVHLDDGGPRPLGRPYGRIDNARLQEQLLSRVRQGQGRLLSGRVESVSSSDTGVVLGLGDGTRVEGRVLVDATGSGVGRSPVPADIAQVALGRVVELEQVPWSDGEALWMDFRGIPDDELPSFLYALPLGGNRVLLEETSLASHPPMPISVLERRLDERIARMGLGVRTVVEEERVFIPLDAPIRRPDSPVVAFGAAAGFVHPSTGYSVIRSLRRAPVVAAALHQGLSASPLEAARAAHDASWSTRDRVVRALHHAGLQVLLGLDAAHTRRFFAAFFDLSPELQAAWLDPTGQPAAVARAMATLFGQASWGVRSDVFFGALEGLKPPIHSRAIQSGGSV